MTTRTLGYVIIIIGIMMIVYTGVNFITTERVVEIGSFHIDRQENHPLQWSPILGVLFFIGGIVLIVRDRKLRT